MEAIISQATTLKALGKIPTKTARLIVLTLNEWAANPTPQANTFQVRNGTDTMRSTVGGPYAGQ